jgi:hypothetical protein
LDKIWNFGNKKFFKPILTPLWTKIENFCQNWSPRAGKLAGSLFLYGESEKMVLRYKDADPQISGPEDFADIAS